LKKLFSLQVEMLFIACVLLNVLALGILPYGVNLDIPVSTIPEGWEIIFEEPYSHGTTTSHFSSSADECIFVGAKSSQSATSFLLGAYGETSNVLQSTGSTTVAYFDNGAYWYNYYSKSFGFSNDASIYLNTADTSVSVGAGCEYRLSWHTLGVGGWRAGCNTRLNSNNVYYKYVLSGSCTSPSPKPTDIPTVSPTTSVPTSTPTHPPTFAPTGAPCVDKYWYCNVLAADGGCYSTNLNDRMALQRDCPLSCGTCFNSTIPPTSSPTECIDGVDYCETIKSSCNSTDQNTLEHMITVCVLTCGYCNVNPPTLLPSKSPSNDPSIHPTAIPTASPSTACVDKYDYCENIPKSDGCESIDSGTRMAIQENCRLTCGTCFESTYFPSPSPTICSDTVGYCNAVKSSCNSSEISTRDQLMAICAYTCGFCTAQPTMYPSGSPSPMPSGNPSTIPTNRPTVQPSSDPTVTPSSLPSTYPTTSSPTTPCANIYDYCDKLVPNEGCLSPSYETREAIQRDCPVACGTCYGKTLSPSLAPTDCVDRVGYCDILAPWCDSEDLETSEHMYKDCPATCGFCAIQPAMLNLTRRKEKLAAEDPGCFDMLPHCNNLVDSCDDSNAERRQFVRTACPKSCETCKSLTEQTSITIANVFMVGGILCFFALVVLIITSRKRSFTLEEVDVLSF